MQRNLSMVISIWLPCPSLNSSIALDIISTKSCVEYVVSPAYTPGLNRVNSSGERDSILLSVHHTFLQDLYLAELYQVTTGNLNKAVKRNLKRFPPDFMFQLTEEEWKALRFQNGIIKKGRGEHTKYFPYAFTEQGLAMQLELILQKS